MENKALARSNDQVLDGMLRQLTESDIVSKIKRLVIDALPSGAPSEESIAEALHISPRTLNRRLADQDTSYRELLSEVRRDMAEKYIADPTIPIAEISYLLGFSEVSSFSRAFKRWTGEPPGTFRAKAA
jgi:AraC-like DNA-binding protein